MRLRISLGLVAAALVAGKDKEDTILLKKSKRGTEREQGI